MSTCVSTTVARRSTRITVRTKGCKRVDLPGITTDTSACARLKGRSYSRRCGKTTASPPEFPKVDSSTQKARDDDRKQILLDELKIEEQKLANLKKEFNNGEPERRATSAIMPSTRSVSAAMKDDLNRVEKNIEALKREIANVK